ncbi:MAG TPA: response regulator, partial [Thermoanaerobaculia bacterium]|nr:response regulator [Thermoanaerobaculia bacterium]
MTAGRYASLPEGGLVLAVDDQPESLELVAEILAEEGYRLRLAADGQAALDAVASDPPDCIVLDVMMPRLDGLEVCRRLKQSRRTRFIPIVMLTALSAVDDKVAAFEAGADDFLNKPVHANELRARVRSLVRIKRLRDELDTSEDIVVSMIQALERKDPRHAGHSQRVARRAVRLARRLGLGPGEVEMVGQGALLHDLGKIGVSQRLLGRDDLAGAELVEYQRHPLLGEQILKPLRSFSTVRAIIRHHHERLDGRGYPDRLGGGELDLATQMVALANLYDHVRGRHGQDAAALLREAASRGEFHRELVEEVLSLEEDEASPAVDVREWMDRLPGREEARTGRILVVDDTEANREVLLDVLTQAGHQVITASSGAVALDALVSQRPDLVLLDIMLPDVNGFDLCRQIKQRPETEFLPVILVTAHYELRDRTLSARAGADDFLTYPVHRLELVARVKSLLRLRLYFQDLEEYQSVILSLASALETKDPYTHGHSERVGFLASRLGGRLGLADEECETLLVAGLLHDIGKIGVSEALLNKPGRLTDEELAAVMEHPVLGEEICRPLRSARQALPMIRHHHERYDGSGYPDRLTGEAIPFGDR